MKQIPNFLSWLLPTVAFFLVGMLIGWLTGLSNSPVTSAVIPVAFSLIGAFSFGLIEKTPKLEKAWELISKLDLTEQTTNRLADAIGTKPNSTNLRSFWALSVIVFAFGCFLGVNQGIQQRAPQHPTTQGLVSKVIKSKDAINEREFANLTNLHFRLIRLGTPSNVIEEIFTNSVRPIFEQPNQHWVEFNDATKRLPEFARAIVLAGMMRDLLYNLERPAGSETNRVFRGGGTQGV